MSLRSSRHWCSLFQELMALDPPWSIADAALDKGEQEMEVRLRCASKATLACPSCGTARRPLREQHLEAEFLLVGGRGVPLGEFLATPLDHWIENHASGG